MTPPLSAAVRSAGSIFPKGADSQETNDYIWKFFADIAWQVKKDGVPGYLSTMAYAQYNKVPDIQLPDNLLIMIAMVGSWFENTPGGAAQMKRLSNWHAKLGNKTWLWTYPGKYYSNYQGIPHTTPRVLGGFIKRSAPHIFGLFIESETDFQIFNYLTYHVFGKLAWDTNTDVEKLLDEHAEIMYGPTQEPMKEFFESVERNWLKIVQNIKETDQGPVVIYPSDVTLWNEIYSPAERKRINALFDKAEKLCIQSPVFLKRVKFLRKEMWNRVLEAEKSLLTKRPQ